MKQVPGYDYYITVDGNICNKRAKILSPYIDDSGFYTVSLYNKGSKKNFRVHNLVAQAYIDNPNNCVHAKHINGDKSDNNPDNLQWVKKKYVNRTIVRKEKEYIDEENGLPIDDSGDYFITEDGKIYNKSGLIMSTFYEKRSGFEMVTLRIQGNKKDYLIHRLVAKCYISNSEEYKFIKHRDGDISNNKASNLSWVKNRFDMKTHTIHTLPEEQEFREIPSYPNYFITKDGKVYSLKTGKYLKLSDREGYNCVQLYKDGKQRQKFVHKLVAQTYLEKKDEDVCVNHKNGKPKDNRVENLEWCAKSHDVKHALSTGLNPGRKRPVVQIKVKYKTKYKEVYPSLSKASRATKTSAGSICTACQNRTLIGAGRKATSTGKVYKFRYLSSEYKDGMPREIVVREMEPIEKVIRVFDTAAEAGRETGIDPSSITHCCQGRMKFACSEDGTQYIWRYETLNTNVPDIETEDWKYIPGFSQYKVSKDGEVFSLFYNRLMDKQSTRSYETISLVDDDGDRHGMRVHRLVALAFHENPDNKRVVNHKDKEKKNNKKDNLEWNTDSENALHAMDNGLDSRRKKVIQYDKDGSEIRRYKSVVEAANAMGVTASTVTNSCTGRQKTCKEYVFRYE